MQINFTYSHRGETQFGSLDILPKTTSSGIIKAVLQKIANLTSERIYVFSAGNPRENNLNIDIDYVEPDSGSHAPICSVEQVRICEDGKTWRDIAVNPVR